MTKEYQLLALLFTLIFDEKGNLLGKMEGINRIVQVKEIYYKPIKTLVFFIMMGFSLSSSVKLFAHACPACSNPALQSSEKLEAGMDTLYQGAFRATLNITNGFDYQGGHFSDHGLSPEGKVIEVPLHEHIVELDFVRSELALEYTFATNWTVWLQCRMMRKYKPPGLILLNPLPILNKNPSYTTEIFTTEAKPTQALAILGCWYRIASMVFYSEKIA